jgi:hypothetical protein
MNDFSSDAPSDDEIEISIFGKGYGEAIAIHVGDRRWIAIDSVEINQSSITRYYLEGIGHAPADHLDVIVATHWHDDHVRGIADLFEVSAKAEIIVPAAMLKSEFIKFAASFGSQSTGRFTSGVQEFGKILEIAASRNIANTTYPLRLATHGYLGYRKGAGVLSHGQLVTLEALSPSHFDVAAFIARVGGARAEPQLLQRAPSYGPNDVSSAFWLQVGDDAVLFGADVENMSAVSSGWNAILSASVQPTGKASLVKIPHHGGLSGHHKGMWTQMLIERPIGTLTPWSRGGNKLPVDTDLARLSQFVGDGFATGPSAFGKEANQPPTVAKMLRRDGLKLHRVADKIGQVRHRGRVVDGKLVWKTDLFGRACQMKDMAA